MAWAVWIQQGSLRVTRSEVELFCRSNACRTVFHLADPPESMFGTTEAYANRMFAEGRRDELIDEVRVPKRRKVHTEVASDSNLQDLLHIPKHRKTHIEVASDSTSHDLRLRASWRGSLSSVQSVTRKPNEEHNLTSKPDAYILACTSRRLLHASHDAIGVSVRRNIMINTMRRESGPELQHPFKPC
eukprot:6196087-Pleurochrysis_carterae.AAC.2